MSVGQYLTPDYRVIKTQPVPSTQQTGRWATDRPSTLLLMTLGFQEPTTAITPTCVGAWVRQCCGAGHPRS